MMDGAAYGLFPSNPSFVFCRGGGALRFFFAKLLNLPGTEQLKRSAILNLVQIAICAAIRVPPELTFLTENRQANYDLPVVPT